MGILTQQIFKHNVILYKVIFKYGYSILTMIEIPIFWIHKSYIDNNSSEPVFY